MTNNGIGIVNRFFFVTQGVQRLKTYTFLSINNNFHFREILNSDLTENNCRYYFIIIGK